MSKRGTVKFFDATKGFGFIKEEGTRDGLQELVEGKYVVEYNAGLGITAKGLKEVKNS